MIQRLNSFPKLFVKQTFELAEIFGFETRNKYRICNEQGQDVAFAAEQRKGFLSFLFRQFLGHWRTFEIHFFDSARQQFMTGFHPFRWYFSRLELQDANSRYIGAIERRFAFLGKKFEVHDSQGRVILEVYSPIWRIWTFPFVFQNKERARILKKWTGIGAELFTDKDTFLVDYIDHTLSDDERALVLAAAIYVDLMYFENKGGGGVLDVMGN